MLFQRWLKRHTANADETPDTSKVKTAPAAPAPQIRLPETLPEKARLHPDPAQRLAAIEQLDDPSVLVECAIHDALAAHRARALERLDGDKAALEEVARRIGKKDKRVYRMVREKLRLIAEREERPRIVREHCEELCTQVERLGRLANWNQDRALLDHLERQWSALRGEAEPEYQARFERERARFLDAHAAHLQEQAKRQAETQARTAALQSAESQPAASLPPQGTSDDPAREGNASPVSPVEPPEVEPPARPADPRELERLEKTSAQINQMLGASKPLDYKQAQRLLDQGRALAARWPESEPTLAFQPLAERLESRLRTQRKHAEQRLRQFPERLAELDAHLAEGELKQADPLHQSLLSALELIQSSGIEPNQAADFNRRLRALAPRLRELQQWRRWGADQHREMLCTEMESLLASEDLPFAALAERLHALQMDWKGLDKAGSPANQALWDRFHAASERVYERCRPFIEAQAVERETNRLAREQLCEQLETFVAQVDWERVDWKKTLHAEREMRQAWAAIGPTEGRVRKALERRFHQSLRLLDRHLDAERQHNQALKRDLVARVQALVETPDLESAIEQTKALQREWHTTVPARQKDENRLWREFRAACDAVFERRTMRQQVQAQELAEHLALREALCEEAERLAAGEHDPRHLAAAQRDLIARWREAESLPVPRQVAAQITRRWQACREALECQRQTAERGQRLAALKRLEHQAALCERLELAMIEGRRDGFDPEGLRCEWAELPAQADHGLQRAITARFERAMKAVGDAAELDNLRQSFAANGRRRAQLCLQLEIAAGVETPPEFAQQRLELQVARLAERLSEGEEDSLQSGLRLLDDWYLLGPAPRDPVLEQRFEHVKAALLPPPSEAP
jgi:DNA repair protein SbcC/Rad50